MTQHVRAQRGQRREGRPRADARGRRRDRRPAAVPVGLRRRRAARPRPARRRTTSPPAARSCGRASRRCCWSRSAPTRCSRGRWWSRPTSRAGRRGARAHRRRRRALVRRPAYRRPAARGPDRGTPRGRAGPAGARCTRRRSPTGWSPSSACPWRAGAAPPSAAAGGTGAPMLEEIRIGSLGVIESSTLELGPGLTVITGETGAGKTMIVTALGLLLGGRADSGAVRTGARPARVEGVVDAGSLPGVRRGASTRPGERSRTAACVLARTVSRRGPIAGLRRGRVGAGRHAGRVTEPLVAVHGQSDQHRLLHAAGPARRAGPRSAATRSPSCSRPTRALHDRLRDGRARARRGHRPRPGAGPRGRPAPLRAR